MLKVNQFFYPNKVHGHGGVCVRILKFSCTSIIKPFKTV